MSRAHSIRRRLLREAVEDNYLAIHGQVAPSARRRQKRRRLGRLAAPLAAVAVVLAAGLLAADWWLRQQALPTTETKTVLLVPPPAPRPTTTEASPVFDPSGIDGGLDRGVLPFSVRRVAIDPGHGGEHRGTAAANGLIEKNITLDIATRLARLLEANGFEAILTRDGDETIALESRGDFANEQEADIFLSIHVNWFGEASVRAIETFYLGPTDDPELQRLAARENLESELALGEFRQALERVYADVRRNESRELAEVIQTELLKSLKAINPWVENRGVKSAPFGVLIRTQMPAVLAEIGCLSNDEEAQLLRSPDYRQYLAEALLEGVRSYAYNLNPNLSLGS